jgi:hypothetical protein
MALTGHWLLDGLDIYSTYRAMIAKGGYAQLLNQPQRKPSLTNNWLDQDGLEIDLVNAQYEAMDVDVPFYIIADNDEYVAYNDAFFAALMAPGERSLVVVSLMKDFAIYYKETLNYEVVRGKSKTTVQFTVRFGMNSLPVAFNPTLTPLNAITQADPTLSSATSVTVNYNDPNTNPGETAIEIQYDVLSNFSQQPVSVMAAANSVSYLVMSLTTGITYHFRVRAVGNNVTTSTSGWSAVKSIAIPPDVDGADSGEALFEEID